MRASATYLDHVSGRQSLLAGDGELFNTKAVALLMHGGKENSIDPALPRHAAVWRMAPIARRLVILGAGSGLAVWRLRFRYRGWNNAAEHPLEDARWALRQLRSRHAGVPIVLVGYSMGGRAALRVAGENDVTAVAALAPWLPSGEVCDQLAGRRLLVMHGTNDRVTSAQRSRDYVHNARAIADEATFIAMRGCGHTMARRSRLWHQLTAQFVLHAGLGIEPPRLLADVIAAGEAVL